jgi:aspartate/methionine/tyrosine aminotransferase
LFIWAKAPQSISNVERWIDEILYATRVFITPGFIFGDEGKNHIRISLCANIEKMEEALGRIRKWKSAGSPGKKSPSLKAAL